MAAGSLTSPRFMTLQEVATTCRVSPRTVRRWLASGRLPYHQTTPRSRVLIQPADLERYLARHESADLNLDPMIDHVLNSLGKAGAAGTATDIE